ncbi:unnamed protein product [Oppiella nova]|uniref:PH domain-containing protein n=1 Tax=Oppiella nova TaxID=334625 RepID=A0A7R9LKI3_9ACAR|nr:unnamed protein product [Oppiella nova]CAG2163880.1 unnamed protein product [Oppiella nova]
MTETYNNLNMEHWGIWDWTKFICCNHRPLESGEHLLNYPHPKNGVNGHDLQELVVNSRTGAPLYRPDNDYAYYYADNPIGYLPVNVDNDSHTIMDGLRLQLHKRKGNSLRSPPVRRSNESQVTLRSWLYRLEGAALKQWKRRWCVLADYCLFYYKDMEEERLLGSLLLPSYKITPCLNEDGIARKYAFKAEHNNMKTYYFAADSKECQTQWMNSLSLASIMQLSSAFSTVRNDGDGQEVTANNDDEEESGFASYQSRRSNSGAINNNHSYDNNIGSDDKYPGSYNSVGLPVVYQQNPQQRPIQRSHYVNAPPKPKRQYYDNSDLYVIPPSAQYHHNSHQTPDLIAHDSYNSNYLPNTNYFTQSYPPYEQQSPPQYRLPPPSHTPRFSRLPPRPHSADFLERDQEEDEDEDECQKIIGSNGFADGAQRPDNYYSTQTNETSNIMPVRPKSSLDRYDPYSRYFFEQQTNYVTPPHYPPAPNSTGKEPRPWSDYLVGTTITSPQSDNQMPNQTLSQFSSSHLPHYHSSNANSYGLDAETPRNYQREESLQRLLEWKQRMLQSPLNKRNWSQQQQQQQPPMQQQSTKSMELPSRPPLPEEYRSKFTIKDALKGPQQRDRDYAPQQPYKQRERSKSIGDGSDFVTQTEDTLQSPQKSLPVNYSSDDEAEFNLQMPYNERPNETMKGQTTPDYININSFGKETEADKESDLDISKEDYYKASTMFYQRFCESGRQSILMSPVSFNESVSSKNDSIGQTFNKQDWTDVGLPVPDETVLARTASRRSLKRITNNTESKTKSAIESPKREFTLDKREDGDGVDEYSVKCLLKKFSEFDNKNAKPIVSPNESKHYNGEAVNQTNYSFKCETSAKPLFNGCNVFAKSYVSDSEILDNNSSIGDEENSTSKSAPLMLSPLTKVLADLRKTADVRKEKLYSLSRNEFLLKKPSKVEEVIATKGALQLLDNSTNKSSTHEVQPNGCQQSDYLNMNKVVKGEEDVYVAMDGEEGDKESDAGDDADDEASRDFDCIVHHSDIITDNDIKLKAGCKVRTYKKPRPEPVPNVSNQLALNPNPAYEAFDGIQVATSEVTPEKTVTTNEINNNNTSAEKHTSAEKQRSPNAPYYMSDLLSEEQQIALQEKLAARQTGSPPPLLSRCNALNNTRYLGTTSLQKCDVGKRVNNINLNSVNKNDSTVSLNNCITNPITTNNAVQSPTQTQTTETIENSLKSLLLPNVSKFIDSERNKYEAGNTLQKVPQNDKSFASYTNNKRCITPDLSHSSNTKTNLQSDAQNCLPDNFLSLKRRSKSLEGLMDQQNSRHIYENIDQQTLQPTAHENDAIFNTSDNNVSDEDFMGTEVLRRVSKKHFGDNFSVKSSSLSQQSVPLSESFDKGFDDFTESESDLSSLIELSTDSVSGPIMAEKVRKRRSSHKRRSKDDLNASDSEVNPKPNLISSKPMHVKPKSLRDHKSSRLCVSTGDLLGKSHEELVLLLIQLRRTQSQFAKNCDQLRLQMESEEKMIEIEPHRREEHKLKFRDLRERLVEYEKQYEMQFSLINAVDNMVKMHNPLNSEEFADNKAKAASTSFLDQVSLEEETTNLSALQQDKEILERTLEGVKSKVAKVGAESVPVINLEKLKKQQRMIESELSRVRGLLSHSAKRLEEKAAENAQIEADVLIAKNKLKQVLANEEAIESNRASTLEEELAHINQVIDDLHSRRVELNAAIETIKTTEKKREIVRASPTGLAGSVPLPGKKKITTTYMETDMDSLKTRDLAHCPRNCGPDGEDNPLYENLENNVLNNSNDLLLSQFQATDDLLSTNPEDIVDEQMRQFYGILPQKPNEPKTVRIVKREAERRRIHFSNGSSKSMDLFWSSGQYDSEFSASGAVGGIGSIPPPYYYEDRDYGENDDILNTFGSKDQCNDDTHCMIDSLTAEFGRTHLFHNSNTTNKSIFLSNDTQLSHPQQELFSRPERTRSASLSLPSTSSNSSSALLSSSSTPFPFRLTRVRRLESKYGRLGPTRRHHTISSSQPHLAISKIWRSRDDTDLQLRATVNTPDIVKSTIKKNCEDFDDKLSAIEREIMLPKKIEIPERYIRDDEPEEMSASEKLKRSLKAEMIRKMLSESSTYEDVRRDCNQHIISSSSSSSALGSEENVLSEESRVKLNEEKKRRAQLLQLNHELAKEVMERSRIVAANNDSTSS